MKLLLVHHAFPPEGVGGSELYTLSLARRLAGRHQLSVLHRSLDPKRGDYDLREAERDGFRTLSVNVGPRPGLGFEAYRDPVLSGLVAGVLDDLRPDLVHVGHLSGLSTGVVFAARRRGIPVVLTLHDFWMLCPLGQLLNRHLQVCPGPGPRRCLDCVGAQVAATPRATARGRARGRG